MSSTMTVRRGTSSATASSASNGITRYTDGSPCPICGGSGDHPRGHGSRCWGYLSSDGKYAHCTRQERAGSIDFKPKSETYPHKLNGACKCGHTHGHAIEAAEPKHRMKSTSNSNPKTASTDRRPYKDRLVSSYIYRGPNREIVMKVDRLRDPKDFFQFRPDGYYSGGTIKWTSGLGDITPIPYMLPELLESSPDAPVYLPEGEKHVEKLVGLGFVATCNPMGAGKWRDDYSDHLEGRHVVILPDNDAAGYAHADQVARSILPYAASIKVLPLPGLANKGDVIDWLESGGTAAGLAELADAAPPWTSDGPPIVPPNAGDPDLNPEPIGPKVNEAEDDPHRLARIFLDREFSHETGHTLASHRGQFFQWDGSKYCEYPDILDDVVGIVKEEFDRLNIEAINRIIESAAEQGVKPPPPHELPVAIKVGQALARNVMQAVKSMTCVSSDLDAPTWIDDDSADLPHPSEILPARNGLINLKTMARLPLTPRFFCPFAVPYDFDPDAPPPARWIKFLNDLWPDDPESIRELQKWFGYMTTLDKSHEKALLIKGPRRSGKGTIIEVITTMLGAANVHSTTLKGLSRQFGLWPLENKALAIVPDARFTGAGENSDVLVERLLSLTSRDPVEIEGKYVKQVTTKLPTRLMIFTNEIPNLRENSGALAGRFIPLQLTHNFYGREDKDLARKLTWEISGILLWAIEGHKFLREDGSFQVPRSAEVIQEEFSHLANPILSFADECCDILESDYRNSYELTPIREMHYAYQWWCRLTKRESPNDGIFGRNLHASFSHIKDERPRNDDGTRHRCYRGIRLNETGLMYARNRKERIEGGPRY